MYLDPRKWRLNGCSNPLCRTELRAISARSTDENFHTCAATLYSSSNGSAVMCSMSGSSVESDTFMPIRKKAGNGERS